MTTYQIGFIVCAYAMGTKMAQEYAKGEPKDHVPPFWHQLGIAALTLIFAAAWPIVLAVWMRDIKDKEP